jgi:hypothetical protein
MVLFNLNNLKMPAIRKLLEGETKTEIKDGSGHSGGKDVTESRRNSAQYNSLPSDSSHGHKRSRETDRRARECDPATQKNLSYSQVARSGALETIPASIENPSCNAEEIQKPGTNEDEAAQLAAQLVELEKAHELLRKSEAEKQHLLAVINGLNEECKQLCNDNTSLRAQIVSMRSSQDPINDDAYYTQRLTQLDEIIKSWVPSAFKSKQAERDLTDDEEEKLRRFLGGGRQRDQELSFFGSKGSIRAIFNVPRRRMALVRHIFAIYLRDNIFAPFCFGPHTESDLMMNHVLRSAMKNGICHLKIR